MSRNTEYQFISTDINELIAKLILSYEQLTGIKLHPANPERLFIQWLAGIIIQERVLNNYTGNQNLPSRAERENLNEISELFFIKERPPAQPSICTMRFYISEVQTSSILVPKGTRVTGTGINFAWETTVDAYVDIGSLYVDVMVQCTTAGKVGNGYTPGQIDTIIRPYAYFDKCENITESDAGSDESSDDEYYELMRSSQDAFSTAGATGGYIYFAKQVSREIADVVVNSPVGGQVNIYVLMKGGAIAGAEIKNAVLAACNDKSVRPLTDYVVVADAEEINYNIEFTYYIPNDLSLSALEVETVVNEAVSDYIEWQYGKLGRDINPDELRQRVKSVGVKRIVLTSPEFIVLSDGSDDTVPQIAKVGTISVTNGGYENE